MNSYDLACFRQLFDRNFTKEFKAMLCRCFKMGFAVFHKFILDNKDFFDGFDKGNAIKSHLLKFAIEKEVAKSAFTPTSKHRAMTGKLNDYGYKGLYLCTDDFVITLSKTNESMKLPTYANYRKKLSKANAELETQLRLELDGLIVDDKFHYAIITYGRNYCFELSHLNIITPESDYSGIVDDFSVDIMKNDSFVVLPDMVIEEQLATLKSEYLANIKLN